jgi:hypothetical protein
LVHGFALGKKSLIFPLPLRLVLKYPSGLRLILNMNLTSHPSMKPRRPKTVGALALLLASLLLRPVTAPAQVTEATADAIRRLEQQIKELTAEVQRLKEGAGPKKEADDPFGRDFLKSKGLSIGFYGEAKYRFPAAGPSVFDPHRFVLTPSYQINDWLVFNSELELEHGGIDERTGATRSRFDGEVELEQFYVDILLNEHFNVRSLGIDLVPVGRINLYHEPTVFYSTERPELYREIIPSTWFEPSAGVFGQIIEGLDYKLMISSGLEDMISGTTATGINAGNGARDARPRLRAADESDLAYSGRLHFTRVKGLDASASFYVTRVRGAGGRRTTMALWDVEAAYRVPGTGLELRGDFASWHIANPGDLQVNNSGPANDDVGNRLYGWYVEAAYHFWPDSWKAGRLSEMDLVPFVRYSEIVTQSGLLGGSVRREDGLTNKEFLTAGVAWFLNPHFVLKADWRRNLRGANATKTSGANQDYFQIGAGMFF